MKSLIQFKIEIGLYCYKVTKTYKQLARKGLENFRECHFIIYLTFLHQYIYIGSQMTIGYNLEMGNNIKIQWL